LIEQSVDTAPTRSSSTATSSTVAYQMLGSAADSPLATPVRTRLSAWLDYRNATWPDSVNLHLLINRRTRSTPPVATHASAATISASASRGATGHLATFEQPDLISEDRR
jgi:hypothetical protein